jgi:hypothetical protein
LYVIGQGNGAGLPILTLISSPLLDKLQKKGFGFNIILPINGTELHFVGFAFVDDTDLLQSNVKSSWREVVRDVQKALHTWEKCLKTTCGAIVPEKIVW